MQRVVTGKYLSVQYIVSYRDTHAYVYHKYSDTLNTFNMLCPLNKAKVIFTVHVVKNVQVTSKLSPQNHFITTHILFLKQFHQLS